MMMSFSGKFTQLIPIILLTFALACGTKASEENLIIEIIKGKDEVIDKVLDDTTRYEISKVG